MSTQVSRLADVHPRAELGNDVIVGPFCCIGPDVKIGDGTILQSHVVIQGHTTIGERNRFFPHVSIGTEPQDLGYKDAPTRTEVGDDNLFRESVTIHRASEKEDGVTRVGSHNFFMVNAHVAHNCRVGSKIVLANNVLLGGHAHVQDGAVISGGCAVHQFATIGTLAFMAGMARVTMDIPPYMMATGCDNPEIKTINLVGMLRNGISSSTVTLLKKAHRLLFRQTKQIDVVEEMFLQELDGIIPIEISNLFRFLRLQRAGKMGRAREAVRNQPGSQGEQPGDASARRAA
ncbi:MAG: acyl-ACP--UDP-N-acetylglucosamine O-acyltransferase [Planctomycetota bacterium]|nr:acyl-ACP--UDP-N-acetylglucosamine O-acyltransferase [Planctomycetota bacterium]